MARRSASRYFRRITRRSQAEGDGCGRLLAIVLLAAAAMAGAQEGFPLDGTWRGERTGTGGAPPPSCMVMQWDGRRSPALINPGPKAIQIADAQLIPGRMESHARRTTPAGEADRLRRHDRRSRRVQPLDRGHLDGGRAQIRRPHGP